MSNARTERPRRAVPRGLPRPLLVSAASALMAVVCVDLASGQTRQHKAPGAASAAASASAEAPAASATPPEGTDAATSAPSATSSGNYALTISGGISLGAYEAGFNWALIRLLKAQREGAVSRDPSLQPTSLVAVTGASAGNINGVISAIAWCQRDEMDESEGLTGNSFWRTWVPVGWEHLFPYGKTCAQYASSVGLKSLSCLPNEPAFQPDDGLLTRRAFADAEAESKQKLSERDRFRPSCKLPVGMTVTKVKPERIEQDERSSWSKLDVATQRMAVLLLAETCTDGEACAFQPGLSFSQPAFLLPHRRGDKMSDDGSSDGVFGKRLIVPSQFTKQVDARTLLDVVEASSAFPLAFGPKTLKYCSGSDEVAQARCRTAPNEAKFFDGGIFDNVPLGLAIGLATAKTAPLEQSAEQRHAQRPWLARDAEPEHVTFVFVDPDRRRRAENTLNAQDQDELGRGYSYILQVAKRFISVSRTYELQTTTRYRSSSSFEVAPTTRLFPIMGQHLGAFAAFLARPFREYDFYVGVYDAMYARALRACHERRAGAIWPEGKLAACVVREVARAFPLLSLGGPDAESASYVIRKLIRLELDAWLDRPVADAVLSAESPVWIPWLDNADTHDPLIKAIFEANQMLFQQARLPGERQAPENRFGELLRLVRPAAAAAHARGQMPESEWRLFEDQETFYWTTARAVSERLIDIESEDGHGVGKNLAGAISFGIYAYSSGRTAGRSLELDPSTIPPGATAGKILGHVLPYYGSTELIRGGLEIGYRPTLHTSRSLALMMPLSPLSYSQVEGRTDLRLGMGILYKLDYAFLNSIELGPYMRAHYRHDDAWALGGPGMGVEVTGNTLLNHLRVSLSVSDIVRFGDQARDDAVAPKLMLRMGVSDLNGLLYWGGRFLTF